MQILAPRGTRDILPEESIKWQYIEAIARKICKLYGYGEIRVPVFEQSELFSRGIGDTTDIVQKEMYTFTDKGGRTLTLRPEFTAGVVRAFLEHKLQNAPLPVKLFYSGPAFRYERPQAGRQRQFNQFGIEAFGSSDPALDAEIISLCCDFLNQLGLSDLTVEVNSIGCKVCRPHYRELLQDYFHSHLEEMCGDCQSRFDKNPLRILDCKNPNCAALAASAPKNRESLCEDCQEHFDMLLKIMHATELNISVNPRLVRGLDYYTKTVFEIKSDALGAQSSVCGGGRYDNLVEEFDGPATPAVGVAFGMERVLMIMDKLNLFGQLANEPSSVYVAVLSASAKPMAARLINDLRKCGIFCETDYLSRSAKAQFKAAGKINAKFVAVIGEQEANDNVVAVKNMADATQVVLNYDDALILLEGR